MADLKKFQVVVEQEFEITLDAEKFDEAFMQEFRESFYSFDTLEEHAEHIAQQQARGAIDITITPEFIEGYGPSSEMGIGCREVGFDVSASPKGGAA